MFVLGSLDFRVLFGWTLIVAGWVAVVGAQDGYERPPIDYLNAQVNDPCAVLARKVQAGEVTLEFEERFGYLRALLRELDIPVSSQTLVFSKTSLQLHRISPRRPRSLYFNDDVYVGFCQNGEVIEIASTDPMQGATFYTLAQSKPEPTASIASPKFVRDRGECLSCHASSRTQNVPGYLVRSVFADAAGRPKLGRGSFTTDVTSDLRDRWGGWYVTGQHGSMRHMGNVVCTNDDASLDRESGANQSDLSRYLNTENLLTPHSDIVALMVLEHQTQMHNAITAANFETRLALHQSREMNEILGRPDGHVSDIAERRIDAAADRVVRQLLFCNEFALTDSIRGSNSFQTDFARRGAKDSKGRSLRDFNLSDRLFEYPCSYLIDSPSFEALPDRVRALIWSKLIEVLKNADPSIGFEHLTPESKKATLEVLQACRSYQRAFGDGRGASFSTD